MKVHVTHVMILLLVGWVQSHVDPEVHMNTTEIISYYGYPAETHHVTTEDGYILEVHRIPNYAPKGVVFLQHGLMDSSATFVMNTVNNSLGFYLADRGYDVWMGNVRGNAYSQGHVSLSPKDYRFWDFSFDEMAMYDLKAMLNMAASKSNSSDGKISYVGHSQGTEIAFIEFSRNHELAKKVNLYVALAPVARISHVDGFFKVLSRFVPRIKTVLAQLGIVKFLPKTITALMSEFAILNCPVDKMLCSEVLYMAAGPSIYFNSSRMPVYGSHCPSPTSVKNMLHWNQIYTEKSLHMFDYGSEKANQQHYNSSLPPQWDVSNLNIPTVFISGGNDFLGDPRDTEWLQSQIGPNVIKEDIFYDDYNHLDFMWGSNAKERVFDKILKHLSNIH